MKDEPSAAATEAAVRRAMEEYRRIVLDPFVYDPASGLYRFKGRITRDAVLDIADIGRSTLSAEYHADLRSELGNLVNDLKVRCGRRIRSGDFKLDIPAQRPAHRADRLLQEVMAMEIRFMKMEADAARPPTVGPTAHQLGGDAHRSRARRLSRSPTRR